jgi:hypothetical protein
LSRRLRARRVPAVKGFRGRATTARGADHTMPLARGRARRGGRAALPRYTAARKKIRTLVLEEPS